MSLTDVMVRTAKPKTKPYKLADGDGMFLYVQTSGSKYWRLKYRYAGREKLLALGVYPEITLSDARERRAQARKALAAGNDPGEVKKEAKRLALLKSDNTFETVALEWHEQQRHKWVPHYSGCVLNRLKDYLFKDLGKRPIADIGAQELLAVLRVVERRGALDLAQRIMQSCGQIFGSSGFLVGKFGGFKGQAFALRLRGDFLPSKASDAFVKSCLLSVVEAARSRRNSAF